MDDDREDLITTRRRAEIACLKMLRIVLLFAACFLVAATAWLLSSVRLMQYQWP